MMKFPLVTLVYKQKSSRKNILNNQVVSSVLMRHRTQNSNSKLKTYINESIEIRRNIRRFREQYSECNENRRVGRRACNRSSIGIGRHNGQPD